MTSGGTPEGRGGIVVAFRVPSRAPVERGEVRRLSPEEVGTIMVYRYYGEVGNTYPVNPAAAHRFSGYMDLLAGMYNLTYAEGQPDAQGQVRQRFLFEPDNPETIVAEQRFCAVLQMGDEGNISSVSFRMMPTRSFQSSTSPRPRLRLLPNE